MPRAYPIAPNREATHPFDLRYGTDTGGYLSPRELAGNREHDRLNNGYSAVAPSVLRTACQRWRESLTARSGRIEAYTFVDIGAGKGRALLLAAVLPFRKVIGVEINQQLAGIAENNVALYRKSVRPRTKITVMRQDAANFRWPRPPLLVFLNNPFDCELISLLADNIALAASAHAGLAAILYVNPGCAETFERHQGYKLLWDDLIEMDDIDASADPYGASSDRVAAFRFAKHSTT